MKHIIRVSTKKWFDKVNGNTYFATRVYKDSVEVARLRFQYGYENHHLHEAIRALEILETGEDVRASKNPYKYIEHKGYELDVFVEEGCTKLATYRWGGQIK